MSTSDDPLIGAVLDGRYRIDSRLGQGGMGAVYRARQLSVDRDVAVKVLEVDQQGSALARFEVEARIIARLRHPHTVRLIDFGAAASGLYVVMELVQGRALSGHITAGDLTRRTMVELLAEVADALTEAHAAGIVHRDLKPANVVIEPIADRHVARILDFGIAKVADDGVETRTGAVLGTPAYMAPEQVRGIAVGPVADLYALGVTLYEVLVGARPFSSGAGGSWALMMQHVELAPPPLMPRLPAAAPWPALARLALDLMAKDPADRPPSASAVRDRLRALARQMPDEPPAGRCWGSRSAPTSPSGAGAPISGTDPTDASPASDPAPVSGTDPTLTPTPVDTPAHATLTPPPTDDSWGGPATPAPPAEPAPAAGPLAAQSTPSRGGGAVVAVGALALLVGLGGYLALSGDPAPASAARVDAAPPPAPADAASRPAPSAAPADAGSADAEPADTGGSRARFTL